VRGDIFSCSRLLPVADCRGGINHHSTHPCHKSANHPFTDTILVLLIRGEGSYDILEVRSRSLKRLLSYSPLPLSYLNRRIGCFRNWAVVYSLNSLNLEVVSFVVLVRRG
jgi:hypothetical protein